MKEKSPFDRDNLSIRRKDRVLEVGCGHNPSYRSNVIVDKFVDTNYHRSDNIKIYPHQKFINADGENLPFKDKEFDYVICCQVLEHVDNPVLFVKELQRVAGRGYIELPSLIGESLFPKKSHRWVCLEIDNKLVMYEKEKILKCRPDYGHTFLNFLPYQSLSLRTFFLSYNQADSIKYEWRDSFEVLVNSENEYYKSFFTETWTDEMMYKIFPKRSIQQDIKISLKAVFHLAKTMLKRRLFRYKKPISFEEYNRINSNQSSNKH